MQTRDGRVARMAGWRLNWEPGTAYEYHPDSAHWVLVEIIDRVSGGDYRELLQERVTRPAGIEDRVLGTTMPIAPVAEVGEPATPDELQAVLGVRELPITTVTPTGLIAITRDDARPVGHPGGGGIMTAADLVTFYQALLPRPGRRVEARGARRRDRERAQLAARSLDRRPREPWARRGDRRRRRQVEPARHGPHQLGADLRAQRRRRADRLGRPRVRASRSPTSPTASTRTSSARAAAGSHSRASPRSADAGGSAAADGDVDAARHHRVEERDRRCGTPGRGVERADRVPVAGRAVVLHDEELVLRDDLQRLDPRPRATRTRGPPRSVRTQAVDDVRVRGRVPQELRRPSRATGRCRPAGRPRRGSPSRRDRRRRRTCVAS